MCDGVVDADDGVNYLALMGMHIHIGFWAKTGTSDTEVHLGQAVEFFPAVHEIQSSIRFAKLNSFCNGKRVESAMECLAFSCNAQIEVYGELTPLSESEAA